MRLAIHVALWISTAILGFVLYPIKWFAYFKKSKRCPPIEDDLLLIPAVKLAELIRKRQAVLLTTGSSILGLGSDLCGSIRLPSHFCGIYGHKPTGGLVPIDGTIPWIEGKNSLWEVAFTVGPLARYACDLDLLFGVILKPELREFVPRIEIPIQKVKIFYMEFDGNACMTHVVEPEIVRAMRRVVNQFKINGFQVEEANLKRMSDAVDLAFLPLLTISGVRTVFNDNRNLAGEILRTILGFSHVQPTTILFKLVYSTAQRVITKSRRDNIFAEVEKFREDVAGLLGEDAVLLYPVFPSPAHFHGEVYARTVDTAYLTIFNTLGFPATACPVALNSDGLPMGLQVVGNFKMDRLCFKVAEEIEREFGGWRQPPFEEKMEKV